MKILVIRNSRTSTLLLYHCHSQPIYHGNNIQAKTHYCHVGFFSKVTGVNQKIKFPAPRAHTMALRLACPMFKPELVSPDGQGPGVINPVRSVGLHTTMSSLFLFIFFHLLFLDVCLKELHMSSSFVILRTDCTIEFSAQVLSPCISILCFQKRGHSS